MTKILRTEAKYNKLRYFKCLACGTVFEADNRDYQIAMYPVSYYWARCPVCHKGCHEIYILKEEKT